MNEKQRHIFYKRLKRFLIYEAIGLALLFLSYVLLDRGGMIFLHPEFLYPLLLFPFLYLLFFIRLRTKIMFFEKRTNSLVGEKRDVFSIYAGQFILLKNMAVAALIALSSPIYGTKEVDVQTNDGELMVCLDISSSMNARDINGESRLEVSKRLLNNMINKLNGQKVGLCIFANESFIQTAPTVDYGSLKHMLSELETSFLSNQGTDVCHALDRSIKTFSSSGTPKTLILFTDGENHTDDNKEIFQKIRSEDILLFSVAVGTKEGGPIPETMSGSYKMNEYGEMVISKVNSAYVERLAAMTKGKSLLIDEPYPDLDPLLTEINLRSKGYFRNLKVEIQSALYLYPVICALLLFTVYLVIPLNKKRKK